MNPCNRVCFTFATTGFPAGDIPVVLGPVVVDVPACRFNPIKETAIDTIQVSFFAFNDRHTMALPVHDRQAIQYQTGTGQLVKKLGLWVTASRTPDSPVRQPGLHTTKVCARSGKPQLVCFTPRNGAAAVRMFPGSSPRLIALLRQNGKPYRVVSCMHITSCIHQVRDGYSPSVKRRYHHGRPLSLLPRARRAAREASSPAPQPNICIRRKMAMTTVTM
ncbi:hypothetical protein D3C85_968020 [compost metagenome]